MNQVYNVKHASQLLKTGDYQAALELYKKASEQLGINNFSFNINYCQAKLNIKPVIGVDKGELHKLNKYFDHIYVVNLQHQAGKRLKIAKQLNDSGIRYQLYNAVNGYVGEPKARFDEYKKRPLGSLKRYPSWNEREIKRGSHFLESPGAVGYIYTYLEILNDAKRNGYKKFLIIEDDIILHKNFEEEFENFYSVLPNDWKVLQLGASQYDWGSVNIEQALNDHYYFPRQLDTCGSFAIAFDIGVVDEVIEAVSAFDAPFDHLPLGEIYERYLGKCFVAYPNLIMPDVGDSSIRGGRCQYTHGERVKWQVTNFNYPYPRPTVAVILSSSENLKYFAGFSNHAQMALELRLYYVSSDGLRPLHDKEMLNSDYKLDYSSLKNYTLPEIDFCLTLNEKAILTETDLISCLEYLLKLRPTNTTPLHEIQIDQTGYIAKRVSVVIPTYKRPKNLKNALISVLEQDYVDLEVLVVSDNGVDSPFNAETLELVDNLKRSYPKRNLKLIEHKQNRNGAAARNTAIMQSTGEYICFLDDDDIYLPGRISKSVEVLNESKGIEGAVYCGFLGWNSPVNDLNRYKAGDLTLEILLLDYKKHYLHTNTATYKRNAILAINGFDESYRRHQDLEFNLRFFELYDIAVVKESGVRLNPEPSDVSNKIFNLEMLDLKVRFLNQFSYLLADFDGNTVRSVLAKHWEEVLKYINDPSDFSKTAKERIFNGYLQVSLSLGSAQ